MYENAALAEALCRINQWDHCVIPLEALKVALKHRQLDTVAFFLKTQENGSVVSIFLFGFYCVSIYQSIFVSVFTSYPVVSSLSPSTTLSPQSFSPSPSISGLPVTIDIQQTENVINALIASVKKNAKRKKKGYN